MLIEIVAAYLTLGVGYTLHNITNCICTRMEFGQPINWLQLLRKLSLILLWLPDTILCLLTSYDLSEDARIY